VLIIISLGGPWQNSPRTLQRAAAAAATATERQRTMEDMASKVAAQAPATPRGKSFVTFPDEPALGAAEPAVSGTLTHEHTSSGLPAPYTYV